PRFSPRRMLRWGFCTTRCRCGLCEERLHRNRRTSSPMRSAAAVMAAAVVSPFGGWPSQAATLSGGLEPSRRSAQEAGRATGESMSKTTPTEMRAIRTRLDFSKIPTSIQIPNLIEVQRRSYERFLQMDKLPREREDNGLQSVFTSVFPITDFRNVSELEFVDYSIGNWECKCGYLKGLNHLRTACTSCGHMVITDPFHPGDVLCKFCGTYNKNTPDFCTKCGDPVGLQLKYDQAECEERGMTYSAPLKVTVRLTIYDKDPETGAKSIRD